MVSRQVLISVSAAQNAPIGTIGIYSNKTLFRSHWVGFRYWAVVHVALQTT